MSQSAQLVQFPVPSVNVLMMLLMGFLALLLAAILMDLFRRRANERRRAQGEWRSVKEIIEERGLSSEESKFLMAFIKRHARQTPLRSVTVRLEFNRCVEEEMALLEEKGDTAAFDRMGIQLRDIRNLLGLDYAPIGQRIDTSRDLHAGQVIAVARADRPGREFLNFMLESIDEAYFYISLRKGQEVAAPALRAGEEARCRLWRDEDARYLFTTTVVDLDDPSATWKMRHTATLERHQAREHYRVRFDQTTAIAILNASVDGDLAGARDRKAVSKLRGRVTSLSAGGCALVLQQSVAKQVLLRIALELPGEPEALELEARIVSSAPISGGRQLIRTAFVDLDDERRDRVAKHVLHRQQQNLVTTGEAVK